MATVLCTVSSRVGTGIKRVSEFKKTATGKVEASLVQVFVKTLLTCVNKKSRNMNSRYSDFDGCQLFVNVYYKFMEFYIYHFIRKIPLFQELTVVQSFNASYCI